MSIATVLLIITILAGFVVMSARKLSQEIAVPMIAFIAIILAGPSEGLKSLEEGFREFARVGLLFTAVAIPAHILQDSNLFDLIGTRLGTLVGYLSLRFRVSITLIISILCILTTYILAALFHNTTSILVNSFIIYSLTKQYKIPAIYILSAALIASNLGGFSTRWGDTPNIVESGVWGLKHFDFVSEIMPINIGLILILSVITFLLTEKASRGSAKTSRLSMAHAMVKFKIEGRFMSINNRLVITGLLSLAIAIIGPLLLIKQEITLSALSIVIALLGTPNKLRTKTLYALGIETYFTLISIFIMAQVFGHSKIGINHFIEGYLSKSPHNIIPTLILSYLGTLSTEAASWATATSPLIHTIFPTHLGAWALGAGICAGSSSLLTAASAGIILSHQTSKFDKDARVDFATYLKIGLPFSIFMLVYYSIVIPLYRS